MVKISAVIITFNEERYIEQCIRSVMDVADEIVVVDSLSTDRTPEICKNLGVKFIEQKFLGYKEQKNFALEQASYDHILSLDADEALSVELRNSILKAKNNWKYDGYKCYRLNNYCGQWMFHTSLYPERKLRLFDRRKGKWGGINPHDRFKMESGSRIGLLKGNLLHWVYDSIEEHIAKINQFSSISAREYFKLGRSAGISKIIFRSFWRFFHSYIIKAGFVEGYMGYIASKNLAYLCFLKYAKLRGLWLMEKKKKKKQKTDQRVLIAQGNWSHCEAGYFLENNLKPASKNIIKPEKVSVIMTTYNQPEWLRKVLWGYEVQTFKGFEVIIADDGSGPETKAVVDWFKNNSTLQINHVWHPDEGYQKCRILNKALLASKGDYLIFTDGDCIPRYDFVETHLKYSEKGYFLSGGAIRLPMDLSTMLTQELIKSQIAFQRQWLLANGLEKIFKSTKLIQLKSFSSFMNFITTAKATWNGGNASGWKKDFFEVNGFNEDLLYGGQDREFGQRLRNLGIKPKQIRYSAVSLHLEHGRPYKTKESIKQNIDIRKMVKQTKTITTPKGIVQ